MSNGAIAEAEALHKDLVKAERKVRELKSLLALAAASLWRHEYSENSPACTRCGGEVGRDVGANCPIPRNLELLKRIASELEESGT